MTLVFNNIIIKNGDIIKEKIFCVDDYNVEFNRFRAMSAILMEEILYIPVVRYSNYIDGTETCMYNTPDKDKIYMGTFYWVNKSSNVYLISNKTLITPNKITAYYYFTKDLNKTVYKSLESFKMFDRTLLTEKLNVNKENFNFLMNKKIIKSMVNGTYDYSLERSKLDVYGCEENYDQELCEFAQNNNIDCIIFTYTTDDHEITHEVLDCRVKDTKNRINSYKNLIIDNKASQYN